MHTHLGEVGEHGRVGAHPREEDVAHARLGHARPRVIEPGVDEGAACVVARAKEGGHGAVGERVGVWTWQMAGGVCEGGAGEAVGGHERDGVL